MNREEGGGGIQSCGQERSSLETPAGFGVEIIVMESGYSGRMVLVYDREFGVEK